jgi:hypothetical protein
VVLCLQFAYNKKVRIKKCIKIRAELWVKIFYSL